MKASKVYLYAAVQGDYEKCLAAADVSGIPRSNVLGNFAKAWELVSSGTDLVIAVGGAALHALYYNECDWPNPSGEAGGHTPFAAFPMGHGIDSPKANMFVNAAGYTALDSLKLAVMLAYYAVHGTFPHQYQGLPRQETPQKVCVRHASPDLGSSHTVSTSPPRLAQTVGVYADFVSAAAVQHAIQLGWKGIGCTGALGIHNSPYAAELSQKPDKVLSESLSQTNGDVWWISFWTVSWPAAGDSFYDGGYVAGKYAAETITSYHGKYIPNYLVIDPEGYNTPANSPTEWADWFRGWSEGIQAVNPNLKPGFYCNQYQYVTFDLATIDLPAFIAVSPIDGNSPTVRGGNVMGYIAYYATCPATDEVAQVKSWGGKFNTIQFRDSGVDCAP